MKLSKLFLDTKIVLAPMAGISDSAFRLILRGEGLKLAFSEMVSSKGLINKNKNTLNYLKRRKEDAPLAVQIFGSDPDDMAKAAKILESESHAEIIDINMGCPARKIFGNGDGAALMGDIERAACIVNRVKKNVSLPVGVKFRLGIDDGSINVIAFGKKMQSAGADFVSVHGRTVKQMYEGEANWDYISELKSVLDIPVIGNGDIFTKEIAKKRLLESGVDAIMIGRGFRGNPFLIKEIHNYLNGENSTKTPESYKNSIMIKHLELMLEEKGEKRGILEFRKHAAWYTKGMRNGALLRKKITSIESINDMKKLLDF